MTLVVQRRYSPALIQLSYRGDFKALKAGSRSSEFSKVCDSFDLGNAASKKSGVRRATNLVFVWVVCGRDDDVCGPPYCRRRRRSQPPSRGRCWLRSRWRQRTESDRVIDKFCPTDDVRSDNMRFGLDAAYIRYRTARRHWLGLHRWGGERMLMYMYPRIICSAAMVLK